MTNKTTPPTSAGPLDLSRYDGHHPGPWRYEAWNGDERLISEATGEHYELPGDLTEPEPTQRLIADAPALLAELRMARTCIQAMEQRARRYFGLAEYMDDQAHLNDADFMLESARKTLARCTDKESNA